MPELKPAGLEWTETPETLRYIYHYPFMPKGIIGLLIVRLNEDIETRGTMKVVWENGMVIQKDHCRAQVQFVEDKAQGRQIIKMEVQGKSAEDRKNVLRDIRQQLEIIHRRSFPSLKVFQKVPCNCCECEKSVDPFEHDFKKLIENKEKNNVNAKTQCGKSFENVPVQKLLDGVFNEDDIALKTESSQKQQPSFSPTVNIINQPPVTSSIHAANIYSYAAVLVILAGIMLVLLKLVDFWEALFAVVGMVVLFVTLGAFQLRNDDRLSEKSFLELLGMTLKKIPPLSWFQGKKNNDPDRNPS
ncbi:MAG: hypothetical protein H6937_04740 [Burkholderiales bacterium]|nr:hypothetical protein [Burkholderiales bacterium]